MDIVLDSITHETEIKHVEYASFGARLAALLIDGFITGILSAGIMYVNVETLNEPVFYILSTVLVLMYKPFCEYQYGATIGKMALGLKVVNSYHKKANLKEILLRNIFHIANISCALLIKVPMYYQVPFQSVSSYLELQTYLSSSRLILFNSIVFGVIYLIDIIVYFSNDQIKSLHDKLEERVLSKLLHKLSECK